MWRVTSDSLPPSPGMRRPGRRRIRTIAVLPTLITSANLLAGVLAISYLADAAAFAGRAAEAAGSELAEGYIVSRDALLLKAAWLVFLGMFCDALDGRVARMTNTTSSFGAQLDSLADVVTFGVTPALIARVSLGFGFPNVPGRILVALGVVYLVGAALRLARYNVESARMSGEESDHVTKVFRGLPSPAAAGVVAALILLQHEYGLRWMEWLLLFITPALGFLMISRLPYSHLMNRYVDGRRPMFGVVFLIAIVFAGVMFFEATMAAAFFVYAVSGPSAGLMHRLFGWPRGVWHEAEDEEPAPGPYPLRRIEDEVAEAESRAASDSPPAPADAPPPRRGAEPE